MSAGLAEKVPSCSKEANRAEDWVVLGSQRRGFYWKRCMRYEIEKQKKWRNGEDDEETEKVVGY